LVWHEEAITRKHDRKAFDCGDAGLNDFLQRYARQSHDLGAAKTILAIDDADGRTICGFYSLAPASLICARAPEILRRASPSTRCPDFGSRLATHVSLQGQGLGGQLLLAAGRRCLRVAAEVGGVMLIIDAKSERAAAWYTGNGAVRLADTPQTLVMGFSALSALLREVGKL
jgi:GNAT superfamily N-acetyltransferase